MRVNHQTFTWSKSLRQILLSGSPVDHGWCMYEEQLDIVWMTYNPALRKVLIVWMTYNPALRKVLIIEPLYMLGNSITPKHFSGNQVFHHKKGNKGKSLENWRMADLMNSNVVIDFISCIKTSNYKCLNLFPCSSSTWHDYLNMFKLTWVL